MFDLAVIIPVKNEVKALPHLLKSLTSSLNGIPCEIIIIDDGEDNTPQIIHDMHQESVRFYRRKVEEQNGLAGAVIAGFKMANSKYVATIDGDGQHPAENIWYMFRKAESQKLDMVMASRYKDGGCSDGLDGQLRQFYSRFLRYLPQIFFPKLRNVTDPLAGCFIVRTTALNLDRMRAIGWKISLEVLLFSTIKTYGEICYTFLPRVGGQSKASTKVGLQYFQQLASLALRYYLISIS
jgi:dolichol-phosphate mannosyltransferase